MNTAETEPGSAGASQGTAPETEQLSIPKHRFDEVSAELRRLREEVGMKDRLYLEDRNRMMAQMQPPAKEPELTPEDTGLDPQTHQAVVKAAKLIADRRVNQERTLFEQQIGILANRTEKAEFLAAKGADKARYLPEVQRMQQDHFQRTATFMPADIAYEILLAKEKDEKIRQLEARLAAQASGQAQPGTQTTSASQPQAQASASGVPNAAATRAIPGGGTAAAPASSRSFRELSVEEMEAALDEQIRAGAEL